MIHLRPSRPDDIPRQRLLWELAFGDSGAYVDNFYHNYYRPQRVLVLEEDGVVQAMTAWFDTTFHTPDGKSHKAGYLYAVATHPDCRGRGFAGRLIQYAGEYLAREHGCQALTTVPAQSSLHNFFAANGFRECFTHFQGKAEPAAQLLTSDLALQPVSPAEYGHIREQLLGEMAHISFPDDALEYQAGCCQISGGGLYKLTTREGYALVCAEGMEDGTLLVKELLCGQNAEKMLTNTLFHLLPAFSGWFRTPGNGVNFGMLKWISDESTEDWNWEIRAYMGLGFD